MGLGRLLLALLASSAVAAAQPDLRVGPGQIPAQLRKPDGPGPFPAVVIAHDCSGLGPDGVCTDPSPRRIEVSPLRRARDVRDAAAYLRTLPYVDARRIGLMGGSHGGATTLNAMRSAGFAAAIALYPRCENIRGVYRPSAPVRILAFDSPRPERYVGARINPVAPGGRGATTGGIPEAWADSRKEVAAFFAAHLR